MSLRYFCNVHYNWKTSIFPGFLKIIPWLYYSTCYKFMWKDNPSVLFLKLTHVWNKNNFLEISAWNNSPSNKIAILIFSTKNWKRTPAPLRHVLTVCSMQTLFEYDTKTNNWNYLTLPTTMSSSDVMEANLSVLI